VDGVSQQTNGVEWTIVGGMPYHGPTLLREVKTMVDEARAARAAGRR
jgi:hypothetical protein